MNYIKSYVTIGLIEIPDEISLIIPVTGCNRSCPECHMPELQSAENGEPFTLDILKSLLIQYKGIISCVCFFEGAKDGSILSMCKEIHKQRLYTALYTGESVADEFTVNIFDYIKVGAYNSKLGGLSSPTTNQRIYFHKKDITYKFLRRTE